MLCKLLIMLTITAVNTHWMDMESAQYSGSTRYNTQSYGSARFNTQNFGSASFNTQNFGSTRYKTERSHNHDMSSEYEGNIDGKYDLMQHNRDRNDKGSDNIEFREKNNDPPQMDLKYILGLGIFTTEAMATTERLIKAKSDDQIGLSDRANFDGNGCPAGEVKVFGVCTEEY